MLTGPAGLGQGSGGALSSTPIPNRANGPFVTVTSASIEPERMEEVLFGRESAERGRRAGPARAGPWRRRLSSTRSRTCRWAPSRRSCGCWSTSSSPRVGGTDKVRVDLRVISSTTRDLTREIAAGRFRQELYRPAERGADRGARRWRTRREDIPELARHFIEMFNRTQGLPLRDAVARGRGAAADDALAGQRPPAAQRAWSGC